MTHPFLSGLALGLVIGVLIGAAIFVAIIRGAEID